MNISSNKHMMVDLEDVSAFFLTEGVNLHIIFKNGLEKKMAYETKEQAKETFDLLKAGMSE